MSDVSQNLKDLFKACKNRAGNHISRYFAMQLAATLKWHEEGHLTRIEGVKKKGLRYRITQAFLGEQPAVFFVSHEHATCSDVAKRVALCAYHSAIEWGVVTNFHETIILNSHWVRNGTWFTFPVIPATELSKRTALFEALTPEGMRDGRIEDLARSQAIPYEVLVPVDDHIVDSLDAWRAEALRFSKSPETVDARLQSLFAQLFILRAVEDRRLAPGMPCLSTCIGRDGGMDTKKLQRIFTKAKEHIQSELFETGLPNDIPDFILKGIIDDLYRPKDFPISGVRYNFSWIEADVLGRAYEKYLSSVLMPSRRRDPQLVLFDQPLREVQRVSRRKAGGVYYTPEFVVRYLTEKALDGFFEKSGSQKKAVLPTVVDPSCGSGSFLCATADSLIRRLRRRDKAKNWGRELVQKQAVVGIDIDPKAVTLARLSLWLRLAEEPKPLPLPHLTRNIVCGDSLKDSTWKDLPASYDIVLGNPPFLAATEAQLPSRVRQAFQSAQGRFDFSSLFVEQALGKLKAGGHLGYVVPNRLFRNTYAAEIRRLIAETSRIITLVDFGSTEVFAGTSTYVGLILAEKNSGPRKDERVRVIDVSTLPVRFPGFALASGDLCSEIRIPYFKSYDARHPVGNAPWNLLSDKAMQLRIQLQGDNPLLDSLATVAQGIKTGANDVFVVAVGRSLGSGLCEITNGFGDHHRIEEAILRPVIYGSEIQRYDMVDPQRFVLYPYSLDEPIPETDLKNRYPEAYGYFSMYRDFLSVRSGIHDTTCAWYELVRRRQSSWLEARKLLIRELATYPCFALDGDGATYLIGGTAVIPADSTLLEPLLAFLNSRISNWYLETLSPPIFRGGYSKFEQNTIQQIPIPEVLIDTGDFRQNICRAVSGILRARMAGDEVRQRELEGEVDHLLADKLGVDLNEIE